MARNLSPWRSRWPQALGEWAEFENLMDRFFGADPAAAERYAPALNIAETEECFEVTADLPGLTPDDVKVELHENELSIWGERKPEAEEKGKTFHRIERRYGQFRRSVMLPSAVDREKVSAEFKNGVLKISVPKSAEVLPRQIQVKVGT